MKNHKKIVFNSIYMEKEPVKYKIYININAFIFPSMERMGLVGIEKIVNIRLRTQELQLQLTIFYVYNASLFA